ncbi:MAG: cyclodeaminase/cyclohydrolase family protein [Raoultibacter sp.]
MACQKPLIDREFIDALASKAATPGGGGASAYCGALASALASMVGNLTVGKKKYAAVEAEVYVTLERLADVRERLLEQIEEDAAAFAPLAAAYGLPRATPQECAAKEAALQLALVDACEVPLAIMRNCGIVIELADFLAYNGSRLALSDVGVAVLFAKAALQGASLNVFINVASLSDPQLAQRFSAEATELIATHSAKADQLYRYVLEEIS